jgi:cysteine desulfurase/selenocysteine lyase
MSTGSFPSGSNSNSDMNDALPKRPFDIDSIRNDFPILDRQVKGKPLTYLDNAATTQKPRSVIEALTEYYVSHNANIHRGIHTLAEEATYAYEETREAVRSFLNASTTEEVVFTRGTTEGINLVASSWGRANLRPGDEIILSTLEHHSNIVPWQMAAAEKGAVIRVIPVDEQGVMRLEDFQSLLSERTRMVSIVHVSNALGVVNPVERIIEAAHGVGAKVLVDGAQSAVHLDIDVQAMDCDFYVFSGHKVYGPTGVGVLYGKKEILESMPPYMGGGEMIREVDFGGTTYNDLPFKFEAGTPNIADVCALKQALAYMGSLGKSTIREHEARLLRHATESLKEVKGLRIIGDTADKVSVISFVIDGVHPQDLGILLDNQGIAVRTGHHCTQPLMKRLGIPGTTRASFALYNTVEEVDRLAQGLHKAVRMLA